MSSVSRTAPRSLTADEFWSDSHRQAIAAQARDVFQTGLASMDCVRILNWAMCRSRTASLDDMMRFVPYKMLYDRDPSAFVITAGIHQNNPTDQLHFSVRIQGKDYQAVITLHFYGYISPLGNFSLTHLTMMMNGNDPVRVCDFAVAGKSQTTVLDYAGGGGGSSTVSTGSA